MKKTIIITICLILAIIIILLICDKKPNYVFSMNNPKFKVEIFTLDGGATTAKYAKFKITRPEGTSQFTIQKNTDVYAIQTSPSEDYLWVIFGGYIMDGQRFYGDTITIKIKVR